MGADGLLGKSHFLGVGLLIIITRTWERYLQDDDFHWKCQSYLPPPEHCPIPQWLLLQGMLGPAPSAELEKSQQVNWKKCHLGRQGFGSAKWSLFSVFVLNSRKNRGLLQAI